jgi:hypothetical protein
MKKPGEEEKGKKAPIFAGYFLGKPAHLSSETPVSG